MALSGTWPASYLQAWGINFQRPRNLLAINNFLSNCLLLLSLDGGQVGGKSK